MQHQDISKRKIECNHFGEVREEVAVEVMCTVDFEEIPECKGCDMKMLVDSLPRKLKMSSPLL